MKTHKRTPYARSAVVTAYLPWFGITREASIRRTTSAKQFTAHVFGRRTRNVTPPGTGARTMYLFHTYLRHLTRNEAPLCLKH